mmetsp:Transcript_91558/g.294214  ORF Transcript_91558/g.294214 Transcript_91558/m.294214 type:complete len:213 (-) Transcript_91558:29-667(-)
MVQKPSISSSSSALSPRRRSGPAPGPSSAATCRGEETPRTAEIWRSRACRHGKSSRSMSSRDCWEAWSKTHSAAATEKLALSGRPIHGTCARNARASSSSIKPSSSSCVTKCTSACTKLPCSAANDAAAKRWHATRVYHSSWNVPAAKTRRSTSIGSAASLDEVGSDVGSGGAVFRASRRRAGVAGAGPQAGAELEEDAMDERPHCLKALGH